MKRTPWDADAALRHERWSFDDPRPPAAPQAREDRMPPQTRDDQSSQAREDRLSPEPRDARPAAHEMPQERRARPEPRPRPAKPGASPWRKIQIPDEDRERAAAAGLYRYVGKPPAGAVKAPSALPIGARFSAPREPSPPPAPAREDARPAAPIADAPAAMPPAGEFSISQPEPAPEAAEEAALARDAAYRARYARRIEAPRAIPPQAQGNPHLGLTVGVIVAVSVAAAIGLSWVAAPTIDATPPQRADLLQPFAPQTQMAEQPTERPLATIPSPLIEVAPNMPAQPAAASAVQPIEVAP